MSEQNESGYGLLTALSLFQTGGQGTAGSEIPSAWYTEIRNDPMLRRARICFDLVFGGAEGRVVRITSGDTDEDALTVTSGTTGDVYVYHPLVVEEPEVEFSMSLGDGSTGTQQIEVTLPASVVSPKDLLAEGLMLAGYGEVSLLMDGMDHDDRIVLIRGDMSAGVTFGSDDESCSVVIESPRITVDMNIPPWVISNDRFTGVSGADIVDEFVGNRVPIVFNEYAGIPCSNYYAPAPSKSRWIVAHGHEWTVDAVYQNGTARAGSEWDQTSPGPIDDLGSPYTEVDFSAGALTFVDNDAIHADISRTDGKTDDVIEIIEKLVGHFSNLSFRGFSRDMAARARATIRRMAPRVLINGSGSSSGGVLSFIESTLCDEFPMISMGWEFGRYGPIVTDQKAEEFASLEAGVYPIMDRESDFQETPKTDLYTFFEMRYNYDPISNTYKSVALRNPDNSILCEWAFNQGVGPVHYGAIDSQFIYSSNHADYVLDWLVEHFAVPSYYAEYTCAPWVFLYLRRGMNILFTESELGFDSVPTTVERVKYARGRCTVGLRMWPLQQKLGGGAKTA